MRSINNCSAFAKILVSTTLLLTVGNAAADHEKAGDILQVLIPAISYGATFYLDDAQGRSQFHKSFVTTAGVTQVLKHLVKKKRPNGGGKSFPSGHTSSAFQGASFVHQRYGLKYALPAYLGAAYVGYSRVESDNHHVEDVIAGAALGIVTNLYFTRRHQNYMLSPMVGKNSYGFTIAGQF